jgi:ribose 1,5-bisphosphokinase PhnN
LEKGRKSKKKIKRRRKRKENGKTKKTKTNLHDIMNSKHIRRQAYSDGEG